MTGLRNDDRWAVGRRPACRSTAAVAQCQKRHTQADTKPLGSQSFFLDMAWNASQTAPLCQEAAVDFDCLFTPYKLAFRATVLPSEGEFYDWPDRQVSGGSFAKGE